jgi:hypothetical protein
VAVGHEFAFSIECSASKHLVFISSLSTVKTYARTKAKLIEASKRLVTVLLVEHQEYHRELVDAHRRDPCVWKKDDIAFAHRTTKSNAAAQTVDKVVFLVTGPWEISEDSLGGLYKISHCF